MSERNEKFNDGATATRISQSILSPWLEGQLTQLLAQRGHAWLLKGPAGLGQYILGLEMVSAWLCEGQPGHDKTGDVSADTPPQRLQRACGHCTSCHAINVRMHADLCVLMPETIMLELGWPLSEKTQLDIDGKKRKPSKEIRVDALRDAVEFSQRTSARGAGKAILVYPAERMNTIAANALLKTLEEPPGDIKFVLATEAEHQLLPTIRSRCLSHTLQWPAETMALQWLAHHPDTQSLSHDVLRSLLRASGGRPDGLLSLVQAGANVAKRNEVWTQIPQALSRGESSALADWPLPEVVNTLQKLCHDLMALKAGAQPRFFLSSELPTPDKLPSYTSLAKWSKELAAEARTVEHPFNPGLMLEALTSRAQRALR